MLSLVRVVDPYAPETRVKHPRAHATCKVRAATAHDGRTRARIRTDAVRRRSRENILEPRPTERRRRRPHRAERQRRDHHGDTSRAPHAMPFVSHVESPFCSRICARNAAEPDSPTAPYRSQYTLSTIDNQYLNRRYIDAPDDRVPARTNAQYGTARRRQHDANLFARCLHPNPGRNARAGATPANRAPAAGSDAPPRPNPPPSPPSPAHARASRPTPGRTAPPNPHPTPHGARRAPPTRGE